MKINIHFELVEWNMEKELELIKTHTWQDIINNPVPYPTIEHVPKNLPKYRLRATQTFHPYDDWEVKKGEWGGCVDSEYTISINDFSWIQPTVYIFGDTELMHSTHIFGDVKIYDSKLADCTIMGNNMVIKNCNISHSNIRNSSGIVMTGNYSPKKYNLEF